MRTLLLFVVSAAGLLAAPVPKAVKKVSDADLMRGRWEGVSLDSGSGPQPDKRFLLVGVGTMSMTNDAPSDANAGPLKLDPDQTPRHLDVTWKGWAKPQQYIYQIDGDTLTISHAQEGQPRPSEFKGGNGAHCFVFKRMPDK